MPRRYGIDFLGFSCFGLSLIFSTGTYFETYAFQRKVTYLDIRLLIGFFSLFVQIPLKKYATKEEIKLV